MFYTGLLTGFSLQPCVVLCLILHVHFFFILQFHIVAKPIVLHTISGKKNNIVHEKNASKQKHPAPAWDAKETVERYITEMIIV